MKGDPSVFIENDTLLFQHFPLQSLVHGVSALADFTPGVYDTVPGHIVSVRQRM